MDAVLAVVRLSLADVPLQSHFSIICTQYAYKEKGGCNSLWHEDSTSLAPEIGSGWHLVLFGLGLLAA